MACKHMDGMDIVKTLASRGFIVEPDALEAIKNSDPGTLDRLLSSIDPSALTISKEDVARLKAPCVKVLSDITNNSTCIGDYDEFVGYFRDRYGRLGDMMRHRISARPIESIKKKGFSRGEKAEVSVIGMVSDVRSTSNGNRLAEIEDMTGSISVLISKDKDIFETPLLLDEVVGVTGTVKDGGLLMASSIIYPDVPNTNVPRRSEEPSAAALISDVHIGSNTFLEDRWLKFIDWLNGDYEDDRSHGLVSRLKYVVVAGDLVDGIGVYPGQEKELSILDIYEQYSKAAEYFDQFPKGLNIIITPGNHDAVRQAEPQPALPDEVRRMFKHPNITFAGNPSAVEIEGVRLLLYHGRSLDDLVSSLPGASYSRPEKAMAELLKRRHLSPIYGGKVMIAPEARDHFVIDPLPDIMHSGHVHTVGVCRYRGVTLVNSGTWQAQTEFQKRMNIQPDPAKIPIVDLHTGDVSILNFGS
ncbi:MAG: DNA-directed DNA polymerase II small subunit [Methanocella conradii]|nr:DNA-directed DNA polymerase II small subunit [Methanocella conradii]MDI6897780.1 DNA-directed DNA polymerase II small subunit [Methanocella conradii]